MFREMRRNRQALSPEECRRLLAEQVRGVLSLVGDGGYPYGLPMDFWYNAAENVLYFHCAREGHKIDAIGSGCRASFCIYDEGYREEGDWPLHIRSVIVFGRIHPVREEAVVQQACRELCRKFMPDPAYFEKEMRGSGSRVQVLALEVEHMTGKLVKES